MLNYNLEAHPDIKISTGVIGNEGQPIILIENFLKDAEKFASSSTKDATFTASDDYYPGIRVRSPDQYMLLIRDVLGDLICKTFKIRPEKVSHARSFLSIVSTPPNELNPVQRIPHFDGTNPEDIAFMHFLCPETFGGTSFYRHNRTGFEFVDNSRFDVYTSTVNSEAKISGIAPGYMHDSNELFSKINSVKANFNRLIIYRGTSLHSGDIDENYSFDTNPQTGRLTVTSFLYSAK